MNNIKTVLISTASLPYEGVSSWTTEMNYLLKRDNELDYVIGPYSNIKIDKPIQVFVNKINFLDKIKMKIDYGNRFINYLRAISKVLKQEEKIILQVKDNLGLLKSILKYLKANKLKNRVYLQYHHHSFLPFAEKENIYTDIDEIILLTELSYKVFNKTCNTLPLKIKINNDGVDSKLFKTVSPLEKMELREKLNIDKTKLVFVWCSHDRKKKGLNIILEVWEKIYKKHTNMELLVFGLNRAIDVKGVKIMGMVPNHDLINYHQASDFYLFSTLCQEGFGLSLVEALKCGSYCIASNYGSVPYILNNGEYGKLIERPNIVENWVVEIEKSIIEYKLNNKTNKYSINIPKDVYDIHYWYLNYNQILIEAKEAFKYRYY